MFHTLKLLWQKQINSYQLICLDQITLVDLGWCALLLAICYSIFRFLMNSYIDIRVPGPLPLPLIGNLHQIRKDPHISFQRMAKKYGSVIKVKLGTKTVVIVNGFNAVREGLVSKDKDFAGRPTSFIGSLVSKNGLDIVFADYGAEWRYSRSMVVSGLRQLMGYGLVNLEELTSTETESLISRFESYNGMEFDPYHDICLTITNIICTLVFGNRYELQDDGFKRDLKYISTIAEAFGDSLACLVEVFPFLNIFPIRSISRLKKALELRDEIMTRQLLQHKDTFQLSCLRDFTDFLIRQMWNNNMKETMSFQEERFKMIAFDIFGAGLDTTIIAIRWALVYFVVWPDSQARAHKELDHLLSKDEPVKLIHKAKLPFVEAIVLETLRMCSLFPLVPRKTTTNTSVGGFDLPRGTEVMFNIWSANHDAGFWANPDTFLPQRFLDDEGKVKPLHILSFFPFSAGCRNCPGECIAKNELFLILARLLQKFEFQSCQDPPSLESTPAVAFRPKPFQIKALAR